jgi:protein FAM32A
MPADEYTSIARGPLKLKGGAGVTKKKKKKDRDRTKGTDLEKNLSTGSADDAKNTPDERSPDDNKERGRESEEGREAKGEMERKEEEEDENKTETERRFAEAKRKRVRYLLIPLSFSVGGKGGYYSPLGRCPGKMYLQKYDADKSRETAKRTHRIGPHPPGAAQDAQAAGRGAERAPGAAERAS